MEYKIDDLKNIARLFAGLGSVDLPESIKIDETALYECCYDMGWETSILDNNNYSIEILSSFFCQLADEEKLVEFIDYYFNKYIENRVTDLTVAGYSIFQLKDRILTSLNALWSISNQEFGIDNSKFSLKFVDFKEYDKMGEGGFCTVYRCPTDESRVYKVLNISEKADAGSVHRFKREYEIMSEQNDSGYTLNVFDYDSQALRYSMEKASISLETYIEKKTLSDEEKDEIVIRCAESMRYLHNKGVIHRDFHPGNILLGCSGEWMITDFGLAKDISSKYSHQTTTTHAVGRAWFTDPTQLFALKDGNFRTDMFSLAKTIDYIMDGNMSGAPHKYSSIVYKATASNPDSRYENINEMCEDLAAICDRSDYESPEEIAEKLLVEYTKGGQLDVIRLIDFFNRDIDGKLMWHLIIKFGQDISVPFINVIEVSFEVALREIRRASSEMQESSHSWDDYDIIAYWAIEIIKSRNNRNDEISIEAAKIIEYVASNVGRFKIKSVSNILKRNAKIDGHIRAQLSYHEGY
ncbi:protein kinase domain-containing protein [Murimonas intestini]|uniref:Serine/threonine protein kinase n=1 Tax=Murimonas intestini TaxID=1337051 RepID=A0AB73SZU5_9FIRM|nr:protein kinase [Murimonas intestini]MCR1843269.1 protein kinase [Murimonas intestini]MCR1868638.1 protein kinase [Murimonas intestini]MCR1885072.1 protein kinase [Murimonas intestini]